MMGSGGWGGVGSRAAIEKAINCASAALCGMCSGDIVRDAGVTHCCSIAMQVMNEKVNIEIEELAGSLSC